MTREEWKKKYHLYLCGLALCGSVSELKDGPLVRVSKFQDIPEEMEKLLEKMWEAAQPAPPKTPEGVVYPPPNSAAPPPIKNGYHVNGSKTLRN